MIEVANVRLDLGLFPDPGISSVDRRGLFKAAARALGIAPSDIDEVRIIRRNIDARKKWDVHFTATLAVSLADETRASLLCEQANVKPFEPYREPPIVPWPAGALRPVVVGTGPAGLFCALALARAGAHPLVVERGACVAERQARVAAFNQSGALDPRTNVQFGEGGAGTFSDGKLTNNMKNPRSRQVLEWFVAAGAPREILWEAHPHIGSDRLPQTVAAIREEIKARGGDVRFTTRLADLAFDQGHLTSVVLEDGAGVRYTESAHLLVLATGHSARDTFALLRDRGFELERKPFAMGVRIEHAQAAINQAQWGDAAQSPALGAAEYKSALTLAGGRSVHTFCMCPGGTVVAATSEAGGIVVNGMSDFARDGRNANAALLVNVAPDDFGGNPADPLAGIALQRDLERRAYQVAQRAGAQAYQAPAQRVGDFLARDKAASAPRSKRAAAIEPTYPRGVAWCDLHEVLPPFIAQALEQALPLFDRRIRGFAAPEAIMTAPETRSSSPVRTVRDRETLQARVQGSSESGVFPCGEGAGYAGGIMSAAVDGLRVADATIAAACRHTRFTPENGTVESQ